MTFRACLLLIAPFAWGQVPRVWDEAALKKLELPLVKPEYSAQHASAEAYYKIPVAEIYKSYPVYAPGHEPDGYLPFLQAQNPSSNGTSRSCRRLMRNGYGRVKRCSTRRHGSGVSRMA